MTMLSSLNPLNGSVVGTVEVTPPEAIPDLVAGARAAQVQWAALGVEGRAELLGQAARRFVEEAKSLGRLITEEMGKPLTEAIPEAKTIGTGLQGELKEIVEALEPETFEEGSLRSVVHRDPFGVCAAITPWNFPMAMRNWMVLPAPER